ncbi:MAG: hypothetical protein ACREDW_02655 [Aestuariivirgaceae bacterium]
MILSLQYYGWLVKGFWLPVSLQGVCSLFHLPKISVPWPLLQQVLDELLRLPAAPAFILLGLMVAGAAKFGRNSIERRVSHYPPRRVSCEHRRALHDIGIGTLHVYK